MQDARDQNASGILSVKHHVPAALHPTEAGTNILACPAQRGPVGKHLATGLQLVEVTDGLVLSPSSKRVFGDTQQVRFGPARQAKRGHGLTPRRGEFEGPPDARKRVACRNAAGIALIDGGT